MEAWTTVPSASKYITISTVLQLMTYLAVANGFRATVYGLHHPFVVGTESCPYMGLLSRNLSFIIMRAFSDFP